MTSGWPQYTWRLGHGTSAQLGPRRPWVMGILNVTPDSFSDGGRFCDPDAAIAHGKRLADAGADVIDIGGESTRPQAVPVSEAEEMRRIGPVISGLAGEIGIPISIDTMKPKVAAYAIECGAQIVNDVGAHRPDETMLRLVAESGIGYVLMHMRGAPATMQEDPHYTDVVTTVYEFLAQQLERFLSCGGHVEQLAFDVGIGFGKTVEHNLALLRATQRFTTLQRPLLVGVSRKSFIGKLLDLEPHERDIPSVTCGLMAADRGASILRVHDVAAHVQALRMRAHWNSESAGG